MTTPLLTLDGRGRVSIGASVRKNGIEPAPLYALTFGPNQTLILSPATITTSKENNA